MYSIDHSFIFVHVPRTAGNSIQTVLLKYSENEMITPGNKDGVDTFEITDGEGMSKHSPIGYYRRLKQYDDMFKFTCVRNPWDRWLSNHHRRDRYASPDEFDEEKFIRNLSRRPSTWHYISGGEFDYIMRFEQLRDDWEKVLALIGLPFEPLGVVNAGDHHHYTHYYTDRMVKAVADKESKIISMMGYTYD